MTTNLTRILKKSGKEWSICALIFILISTNIFGQRRGLFVNQDEVNVWRLRAAGSTATNYKNIGDVQLNSSDDWTRIYRYAGQLLNDTQGKYRWAGPTDIGTVIVPQAYNQPPVTYYNVVKGGTINEPWGDKQGYQIRDAAFVYLVDKNNINRQQYKQRVKEDLLYYATLETINYSKNDPNSSPVTYPPTYYRDSNPGFQTVNWINNLLLAMDFIDAAHAEDGTPDWLTADERESVKTFFQRAANFWIGEMEWDLNRHFENPQHVSDRAGKTGDELYVHLYGNFSTGNSRKPGVINNLDHRLYCYKEDSVVKGGPLVYAAMGSFNNRRACIYRYGLLYGIKFNDTYFIDRGKQFFKDWIKYSVYPNGAPGDMERWGDNFPEGGWGYSADVIGTCGTMAEALSRTGDNSLYNFSTRLGWEPLNSDPKYVNDHGTVCQSTDPSKNFLLTLKLMKKIINREVSFYGTNNINHVPTSTWYPKNAAGQVTDTVHYNTLIDGKIPEVNYYGLNDAGYFMIFGNHYDTDEDIQQMIYRSGPNMDKYWPYKMSPTQTVYLSNAGKHDVWMGDWGTFPGVGFMFGKMINTLPTVSITSPLNNTSFLSPVSLTITTDAADADGGLSKVEFYQGSTLLGSATASPYIFNWTNVPAGSYSITAKAYDIRNAVTVSSSVNITITPSAGNLALNKPAFASSVQNNTIYTPNYAVDGSMSTRWGSNFADPQWIYVDLQNTYNISRVKIGWEGALAKDYKIEISSDANTWTEIKNVTGNTTRINDWTGLTGTGRYIRVYGTARGTVYGYSIQELEVYGSQFTGSRISSLEPETKTVDKSSSFPNPVKDKLTINLTEGARGSYNIQIADALGNVYYENKHEVNSQKQIEVELSGVQIKSGIYYLKLNSNKSRGIVIKIIKD